MAFKIFAWHGGYGALGNLASPVHLPVVRWLGLLGTDHLQVRPAIPMHRCIAVRRASTCPAEPTVQRDKIVQGVGVTWPRPHRRSVAEEESCCNRAVQLPIHHGAVQGHDATKPSPLADPSG